MGMITRVRARLRSLHTLAKKIDAREQDERTAQTVCLLSVVLLLPYLARLHTSLLVGSVGVAYTCLVVPTVLSANYKYPVAALRRAPALTAGVLKEWTQPFQRLLRRAYEQMNLWEKAFMQMQNIANMISQVLFFMLCERLLLPGQRLTCLYSLMFYNVLAYCVAYVKELVHKEDWSPFVNVTRHSPIHHLAMSATKIVLEWTKAVTFVVTLVFMLLLLGLERGLQHYQPSWIYLALTWAYYAATERSMLAEAAPSLLQMLHLQRLEALEELWAPLLLHGAACALSLLLAALLLVARLLLPLLPTAAAAVGGGSWPRLLLLLFLALYANVYLPHRHLALPQLHQLRLQRALLSPFLSASQEQLREHDDVCPVCLCPMAQARLTPCRHLFHAHCLRLCLQASDRCPLCKRCLLTLL